MSLNRAGSRFRASGPTRRVACVSCGAMVRMHSTWGVCPSCDGDAYAIAMTRVRGLSGAERREMLNEFWGSESAVRAALAEARGVGVAS